MNCKRPKFYWIFILLFFFANNSFAQDSTSSTDSSAAVVVLDSTVSDTDMPVGDTIISKMFFESSNDSILKWKRSPEFAYMAYLDSLLKKKKNDLRIDTISIDKNTGSSRSKAFSSPSSSSNGILNSFPVKIFFWLIAIFFIGFILYKLFFKGGLFVKGNIRDKEPAYEEPEKLSDYSAYTEFIHEAESKNDFNLAVRYLYLQSLKKLSERELILFSPDKTNKLYVEELAGQIYQPDFARLTLNYEYVWYGKFAISPDRYKKLKTDFILFNTKI